MYGAFVPYAMVDCKGMVAGTQKAERAVSLNAGASSRSLPQQRALAERRGGRSEGASN